MKKYLKVLLIIVLSITILGCSNKIDNSKLNDNEVYEYLQKNGYNFNKNIAYDTSHSYSFRGNGITIMLSEIYKSGITTTTELVTIGFTDTNYESSYYIYVNGNSYLKSNFENRNSSDDGQLSKKSFNKWLENNGLLVEQIISLMNYYKSI